MNLATDIGKKLMVALTFELKKKSNSSFQLLVVICVFLLFYNVVSFS